MQFKTYTPCKILEPYIKNFIIQKTKDEQIYKVLPDTALVLGFQYNGKLSYFDDDFEKPLSASGVTGIRDSFRLFKHLKNTETVLVAFKEVGASAFFREPLHELFRQSVSLDNFVPQSELSFVEERLKEVKNEREKITIVEKFLILRLRENAADKLVAAAIQQIYRSKGIIRITELARYLNISQSPLEKRFRRIVGTSPKKFASIVRLKNVIKEFSPSENLTELGYEAGFFDQAHFIKNFKRFTGLTPERYFLAAKKLDL